MGTFILGSSPDVDGKRLDLDRSTGALISIDGKEFGIPSYVTSPGAVSYKELICSIPTPPKWYTCHWWGTSVWLGSLFTSISYGAAWG